MTVTRGDVVLVHFPFASGRGAKVRPALVVQSDHNNASMANTIVVQITTNLHRMGEPTQILVDPATPDGRPSGLVSQSAVSPDFSQRGWNETVSPEVSDGEETHLRFTRETVPWKHSVRNGRLNFTRSAGGKLWPGLTAGGSRRTAAGFCCERIKREE